MTRYCYEICLATNHTTAKKWQEFLQNLRNILGIMDSWQILVRLESTKWHYYLMVSRQLSSSVGVTEFFLKPLAESDRKSLNNFLHSLQSCDIFDDFDANLGNKKGLRASAKVENLTQIAQKMAARGADFRGANLKFAAGRKTKFGRTELYFAKKTRSGSSKCLRLKMLIFAPQILLSIDFKQYPQYSYQKMAKYCALEKALAVLDRRKDAALLKVETFPYDASERYLHLEGYDFLKHTLVVGGSGVGKSKFLASMICNLHQQGTEKYRVVVVDPHDALKDDLAYLSNCRVVDFTSIEKSVDLFGSKTTELNSQLELLLDLFHSLIAENYNGRLERVLRFASCVLLLSEQFSLHSLKRLLLDLEFRQDVLNKSSSILPAHLSHFFQTEFGELKNKYYASAIAPIVALVDEMQMVPVFGQDACGLMRVDELVRESFLNIFSLNRSFLGERATKVIAGLIFGQLFAYAEARLRTSGNALPLLIVIDEVAVVETPILQRFLSELRKYQVTVILVGQFFAQISAPLRAAIFANTVNYFLFRTSRADAELLVKNLDCKLVGEKSQEDRISFLAGLHNRECAVRIQAAGRVYPVFRAQTMDLAVEVKQDVSKQAEIKESSQVQNAVMEKDNFDTRGPETLSSIDYSNQDRSANVETIIHEMNNYSLDNMQNLNKTKTDTDLIRKGENDNSKNILIPLANRRQTLDQKCAEIDLKKAGKTRLLDQPLNFDNERLETKEVELLEQALAFPEMAGMDITSLNEKEKDLTSVDKIEEDLIFPDEIKQNMSRESNVIRNDK